MYGHVIAPPLGGIYLGSGVFDFFGAGDPNLAATDSGNGNLAFAAIGSTFRRIDVVDSTHQFYVKTGPTVISSAPTGVWSGK